MAICRVEGGVGGAASVNSHYNLTSSEVNHFSIRFSEMRVLSDHKLLFELFYFILQVIKCSKSTALKIFYFPYEPPLSL